MQNIEQLRDSMLDNYLKVKSKKMSKETANSLANTAGKAMSSVKLQLQYNDAMGMKEAIPFMQVTRKK